MRTPLLLQFLLALLLALVLSGGLAEARRDFRQIEKFISGENL